MLLLATKGLCPTTRRNTPYWYTDMFPERQMSFHMYEILLSDQSNWHALHSWGVYCKKLPCYPNIRLRGDGGSFVETDSVSQWNPWTLLTLSILEFMWRLGKHNVRPLSGIRRPVFVNISVITLVSSNLFTSNRNRMMPVTPHVLIITVWNNCPITWNMCSLYVWWHQGNNKLQYGDEKRWGWVSE